MKIVAFLQNMWVRNPERVQLAIDRHGEEYRLKFMKYALFRGCVTGRRLHAAFGDLCDEIIWEETTRQIAGNAKTIFPADHAHMVAVTITHKPDVIIAFGAIASAALRDVTIRHESTFDGVWRIYSCHPAARQPDTIQKLREAAARVRSVLPA